MYALIDCNSFFCSVEKVFHPGLNGKPVCVLSSNDGCIVALTPEAKALGLHRGDPIFKVQDIVTRHNVHIFSSNMRLYSAMSQRVVCILRKAIAHVENYSIDESFCDLTGYDEHHDLVALMQSVKERILLFTDIPVSIGIAPTKTLAKMGSKFAKQYKGYNGVCLIDTDEKRKKALQLFDLADVWGIGRRTLEKLHYLGVNTPLEFAEKSESWVRANFTKPALLTWRELNGIPCIDTTEVLRNQSICTSRSFGEMITDLPSLQSSVATFASSCANKLRAQGAVCQTITVFVGSNRFREDLPQYRNAISETLITPTSDTLVITETALRCLDKIFVSGISYKKSGVILGDITDKNPMQLDLFDDNSRREQRDDLMSIVDNLNHRFGVKTLRLAVEGTQSQSWHVKCEHRSQNYLTDLDELLTIRI